MINLLDSKATWNSNPKVTGSYCGQEFTGQVIEDRLHTAGNFMIFTVKLDMPIVVFGQTREKVQIWTNSKTDKLFAVGAA